MVFMITPHALATRPEHKRSVTLPLGTSERLDPIAKWTINATSSTVQEFVAQGVRISVAPLGAEKAELAAHADISNLPTSRSEDDHRQDKILPEEDIHRE